MKRLPESIGLLSLWILPLIVLAWDPPAESDAELFFATTRGSRWVYREADKTLTVILTAVEHHNQRTLVTLETEEQGKRAPKERLALSSAGIDRIAALGKSFEPPLCLLKIQSNENREWETTLGDGGLQIKTKHRVFVREEIKVSAGRYKCVRVESEDTISGGIEEHRNRQTDWYAPGVGLVKSVINGSKTELIEFTLGKD